MKLNQEEVGHIARLARLHLTEKEKTVFRDQLSSILEYMAKLQAVDTSRVQPMAHVFDLKNITRDDVVAGCSDQTREILLADLPGRENDLAQVPPVFLENHESL